MKDHYCSMERFDEKTKRGDGPCEFVEIEIAEGKNSAGSRRATWVYETDRERSMILQSKRKDGNQWHEAAKLWSGD